MNINYIDYSDDLFNSVVKKQPPRIYVVDNFNNKQRAKDIYEQPILEQQSIFLTKSELKEKLFPTSKLILKEEKLSIIFYELLKESEKKELAIDNYFNVIDLANDFFHFYDELNEYNVKKIKDLKDWQKEKSEIFQTLRQRYIDYMHDFGYTDKTLIYNMNNLDLHYINSYEEIVFVNIVDFTTLEKQLITEIENSGKEVSIYLQLFPSDFDEQELQLQSVTLPENPDTNLDIYHSSEELLQIVNMLRLNSSKDYIFDIDFVNSNYQQLLSSAEIEVNREPDFTHTTIFKFIEYHYRLLKNSENTAGRVKLRLEDLIKCCCWKEFRNYYKISEKEFEKLFQLAAEDYIYFDKKFVEKELEKINFILEEIQKISRFKNLSDFCIYLENLDLKLLNDQQYKNNITQYFDALAELKSLADMDLILSWDKYFDNKAVGLFRLVVNYMRYKKVKKVTTEEKNIEIEDYTNAAYLKREKIFILNANDDILPLLKEKEFLLSESQREKLGLPLNRDRRLQQKYKFYRHIFNSKQATILYLKNIEKDKTASPFVEELMLKYKLDSNSLQIKEEDYPEVMKSIFTGRQKLSSDIEVEKQKKDKLKIEGSDFPDNGFPMSFYKYKGLKDCYYRFYLQHIGGLEEKWIEFDKKIRSRVLGIIVHDMFEEIMAELVTETGGCDFKIDIELIRAIVLKKMDEYELKIPAYYLSFYEKIMLPHIISSIQDFVEKIRRKTVDGAASVLTEWTPQVFRDFFIHEKSKFYLSGRIDLMIDAGDKRHIIDFKTGGRDSSQLDFYWLLLKPSMPEDLSINKYFYSVLDQRLAPTFSDPLKFQEKLKDELRKFINSEEYFAVYKSRCKNCKYRNICRVGIG